MEDSAKSLVRRYIEEVVNTGDVERVAEFVAAADVEGAKKHVRAVRATYPDLHVSVISQIAEDDVVATRIAARGTHQGTFWGIEPTNKLILIEGVNIDRIKDGKIVEHWGAANTLEALVGIGALPVRRGE